MGCTPRVGYWYDEKGKEQQDIAFFCSGKCDNGDKAACKKDTRKTPATDTTQQGQQVTWTEYCKCDGGKGDPFKGCQIRIGTTKSGKTLVYCIEEGCSDAKGEKCGPEPEVRSGSEHPVTIVKDGVSTGKIGKFLDKICKCNKPK